MLTSRAPSIHSQGMPLSDVDIQPQMTRRRPGQSALTTPVRSSPRDSHAGAT